MSKVRMGLVTILAWLLSATPVLAQSPTQGPSEISWPELESLLLRQGPRLAVLEADVEEVRSGLDLAEVIPNPVLSYVFYGRGTGSSEAINGTQHQVQVEQQLPLWGTRAARRSAARAGLVASQSRADAMRRDFVTKARLSFVELLIAQARVTRLEATVGRMDELCGLIAGRVKAGLFSQYDATRAELERTRFQSARDGAQADVAHLQGELAAMVGAPSWRPIAVGELIAPPPWEPSTVDFRDAPTNRSAAALERSSQAQLNLTDRERLPSLALTAGAYLTTDGSSTSGLVGLAVPVPLFDRGTAALARAQAQYATARQVRQSVALETRAHVLSAMRELAARRRAYEPFAQGIPMRLATLRDMANASYLAGAVSVLVLLDAVRAQVEVEMEALATLGQLLATDAQARALAGATRTQ